MSTLSPEVAERMNEKRSFVSVDGEKEYLFSFCPCCAAMHKRQEIIRLNSVEMYFWNKPERSAVLGSYRVWMAVFVIAAITYAVLISTRSIDIDTPVRLGVHFAVLVLLAGGIFLIAFLSRCALRRQRVRILGRHGDIDVDSVGTVNDIDTDSWDPEDESSYNYLVLKECSQP